MTVSADGGLVLLALLVPLGLVAALVSLPRWFTRSMSKHAFWRLRDEVVDDVIAGELPADSDAVQELAARLEWAIRESRSFDLLHLVVWSRAKRAVSKRTLCELIDIPDLKHLQADQAAKVVEYRKRFDKVAIRAILLSSWLGISVVLWTIMRVLVRAIARRLSPSEEPQPQRRMSAAPPIRAVVREADEEAAETWLGRKAKEFITVKGPALERVPAPALP
jgi:hypothetical protein